MKFESASQDPFSYGNTKSNFFFIELHSSRAEIIFILIVIQFSLQIFLLFNSSQTPLHSTPFLSFPFLSFPFLPFSFLSFLFSFFFLSLFLFSLIFTYLSFSFSSWYGILYFYSIQFYSILFLPFYYYQIFIIYHRTAECFSVNQLHRLVDRCVTENQQPFLKNPWDQLCGVNDPLAYPKKQKRNGKKKKEKN